MAGSNIKAGGAYIEITEKGLDKVQTKLKNFADRFDKSGTKIRQWSTSILASTAAGIAAVTAVAKAFANMGEDVYMVSRMLGMSSNSLQYFRYAAQQSGVSAENLDSSIAGLNDTLLNARRGNPEAIEYFRKLHLNIAALSRMTPDVRFLKFLEAIERFKNPTEVGEIAKSFGIPVEMVPTLLAGSKAFRDLYENEDNLFIMSKKGTEDARELYLMFSKTWYQIKMLSNALISMYIPYIMILGKAFNSVVVWITDFILKNQELFEKVGGIQLILLTVVAALGLLGWAFSGVLFIAAKVLGGISILAGVLKFLVFGPIRLIIGAGNLLRVTVLGLVRAFMFLYSLMKSGSVIGFTTRLISMLVTSIQILIFGTINAVVQILVFLSSLTLVGVLTFAVYAALVALAGAFIYFSFQCSEVSSKVKGLSEVFDAMKRDFGVAWDGIIAAIKAGNLGLVMQIIWAVIKLEWTRGTNYLLANWYNFADGAEAIWNEMVAIIAKAIVNVWNVIVSGANLASNGFQRAWNSVFTWFTSKWIDIKSVAKKGWLGLQNTVGYMSDEEFNKAIREVDEVAAKEEAANNQQYKQNLANLDKESQAQINSWQKDLDNIDAINRQKQEERKQANEKNIADLYAEETKQEKNLIGLKDQAQQEQKQAEEEDSKKNNNQGNSTEWKLAGSYGGTFGSFNGFALATGQVFGGGRPELVFLRNIDRNTKDAANKAGKVPRFIR